jgi:hypothetical protein
MVDAIRGRSGRGGFAVPEISPIQVDTTESAVAPNGNFYEPLVLPRYGMISYGTNHTNSIKHYDALGSTSFEIDFKNVGNLMPYPGGCFMFTHDECYDYTDHGFAITAGADNQWIFLMAITQMGVFYQDWSLPNEEWATKYVPKFVHDYQNLYDFKPWVGPGEIPWGDTTETWSIKKTRTVVDTTATETWYLKGDKHPGQEWSAGPVTLISSSRTYCSSGWGWAPDSDFTEVVPNELQIVGSRVILEDAGGTAPAAPVGEALEPVGHAGVVGWHTAFAEPLTAEGATGFACRWYNQAPLPLPGVYTANPSPPVRYQQAAGHNAMEVSEALPGVNNLYVWAVNDQLTVGPGTTIPFYFMDITIDGSNQQGYVPQHSTVAHYRPGQTAIVEGGVLSMFTPNVGDEITWTFGNGGYEEEALFEMVNGILKFKVPAVRRDTVDGRYYISLRGTDAHGLVAERSFNIMPIDG